MNDVTKAVQLRDEEAALQHQTSVMKGRRTATSYSEMKRLGCNIIQGNGRRRSMTHVGVWREMKGNYRYVTDPEDSPRLFDDSCKLQGSVFRFSAT